MPKALLPADLLTLNQILITGGTKAFYSAVAARGFGYAHWAAGVAYNMGLPATASADYLRGTALLAIASPIFRILRPSDVDKLRFDIAKSYLRTLQRIMRGSPATGIDRDITIDELCALYLEGLERNGLSVENWNLHFPLMILRRSAGAHAPDAFWRFLRDSRRRPVHVATLANLAVVAFIYRQSTSADVKCRQMAGAWLSRNPTIYTGAEVDRKFHAALRALRPVAPADLESFLKLLDLDTCAPEEVTNLADRTPLSRVATSVGSVSGLAAPADDCVPDRASAAVYEALIRRLTAQ